MDEVVTVPAGEIAAMRRELGELTARLNDVLGVLPKLPADAHEAHAARQAARLRGFFWVSEFAAVVGRSPHWVSDRCSARVIRTLKGSKPYRIPLDEEARWNSFN